jgi:inner membrane protein
MTLLSIWWVWAVAGVALAALEVIIPGFIFLGFAIGAVATGFLLLIGLLGTNVPLNALIFAVLSLAGFLAVRRFVGVTKHQKKIWTKDINDN